MLNKTSHWKCVALFILYALFSLCILSACCMLPPHISLYKIQLKGVDGNNITSRNITSVFTEEYGITQSFEVSKNCSPNQVPYYIFETKDSYLLFSEKDQAIMLRFSDLNEKEINKRIRKAIQTLKSSGFTTGQIDLYQWDVSIVGFDYNQWAYRDYIFQGDQYNVKRDIQIE